MRSGISALTEILDCTPQGGGSYSDRDALQKIMKQGEIKVTRGYYWTTNFT